MIKKFILMILIVILLGSAGVFAYTMMTPQKPSEYKIGISYEQALKSDKPMLVLLYVDWCGYCLKFMPKFKTLSTLYGNKFNLVMLNAESAEGTKLAKEVVLTGFPTMYIIDKKYNNRILLNNGIYSDLGKLRIELDRFLRIRTLLDN